MEQHYELMRGWYSGCALAFQASETGSIPVPRSILTLTIGQSMKRKTIVRERNCFVRLALFRKAGSHRKSNKALRKAANQASLGV
jgi:hypothetical protein